MSLDAEDTEFNVPRRALWDIPDEEPAEYIARIRGAGARSAPVPAPRENRLKRKSEYDTPVPTFGDKRARSGLDERVDAASETGISVAAEDKAILKFPGATTKITSLEKPHAPVRPNARLSAAFDSKLPAVREKATKPKTTTVPLHPSKVQTKQEVIDVDDLASSSTISATLTSRSSSSTTKPPIKRAPSAPPANTKSKIVMPVARKKKNTGVPKYSPAEWARLLQPWLFPPPTSQPAAPVIPPACMQMLKGLAIFYFGGEMDGYMSEATRNRIRLLISYGAVVLPLFDGMQATHLIHCPRADRRHFLRQAHLTKLADVPPHIPILDWEWVVKTQDKLVLAPFFVHYTWREPPAEFEVDPRFTERLKKASSAMGRQNSGVSDGPEEELTQKSEPNEVDAASQLSRCSTPGSTLESAYNLIHNDDEQGAPPSSSPPPELGLAEVSQRSRAFSDYSFVASATGYCDSETDNEDFVFKKAAPAPRGFQCDRIGGDAVPTTCPNQHIIDELEKLKNLHSAKRGSEDTWKVMGYNKAIGSLKRHSTLILSLEEAKSLTGVGEKTALKIMEIVKTGKLNRINYENTPDVKCATLFMGIYGVGKEIAFSWYNKGARTLDDVREGKGGIVLTKNQVTGLRFYDDINDRMPREEAGALWALIKPIIIQIDPKLFVEIMGSYRRGKATCGDIDILVSRDPSDGGSHAEILWKIISACKRAGIVTEDLVDPSKDENDEEQVYRGLCRLPDVPGSRRRRIDFLVVNWKAKGAALLYYTGDDIFNRSMRLKARKLGYSLNQRGLWAGVIRDPTDVQKKLHNGTIIASETEEEIFKILDIPWQEPYMRARGS